MMKMAMALIQCMMRSGSGCSRLAACAASVCATGAMTGVDIGNSAIIDSMQNRNTAVAAGWERHYVYWADLICVVVMTKFRDTTGAIFCSQAHLLHKFAWHY